MNEISVSEPSDRIDRPGGADQTRQRLLKAGLRLFGSVGLAGVSTRELAAEAGANQAAIPYHFGGKEGVYLAVAEHIAETTGADIVAAALAGVQDVARLSRRHAATRLGDVLAEVVRTILRAPDASFRGGFILREQLQPTAAFDVLHNGFVDGLHSALSALVARACGSQADAPATVITAHALLGQALVFGMAQQTLVRRLHIEALGPEQLETIVHTVKSLASAALSGLSKQRKETP